MNGYTMTRLWTPLLFATLLVVAVIPARAQKPQKKETTQSTQNTIKEVLQQYQGKQTNLGMLKKVAGDYFVVEDDGVTSMHPLNTIHTLKFVKDDESKEVRLEIRLIARD